MRVRLIRETNVRLPAGIVIDVNETEAARLIAFGTAVEAEANAEAADPKPKKKASAKK